MPLLSLECNYLKNYKEIRNNDKIEVNRSVKVLFLRRESISSDSVLLCQQYVNAFPEINSEPFIYCGFVHN